MGGKVWTPERLGRLRELVANNYTKRNIAEVLTVEFGYPVTIHSAENAIKRYARDIERDAAALYAQRDGSQPPEIAAPAQEQEERRFSEIMDLVRKEITRLEPRYKHQQVYRPAKSEVAQVYLVSDVHTGGAWDSASTMGLSEYNIDLCRENWAIYAPKALGLTEIDRQSHKIKLACVFALGDNVDGTAVFRGQAEKTDLETFVQFTNALDDWSRFAYELSARFDEVRIYGVPGNHARMGKKGEYATRSNWDYLTYQWLVGRCSDLANVKIYPSDTKVMAFYVPGFERWLHVIFHGDQIRMWNQIPFYGIYRGVQRITGLLGRPPHYVHLGHFHQGAQLPMFRGRIYPNGSFCGPTPYGGEELLSADPPTQWTMLLHRDEGIVASREVRIREPRELVVDADGILTPWSRVGDMPAMGAA